MWGTYAEEKFKEGEAVRFLNVRTANFQDRQCLCSTDETQVVVSCSNCFIVNYINFYDYILTLSVKCWELVLQ